jgi:hypothetical protein
MGALIAGALAQTSAGPKGGIMRDKIGRAVTELDAFEKNRAIAHLANAAENLEEVDVLALAQTSERRTARRELVEGWCRVLRAVDSVKDRNFDPDDAPALNVLPPLDGAKQFPPGTRSPAAQKQYETAVAANERKKAERRSQFLARELEERALESAHRAIQKLYTKSAADRKELEAAFTAANLPQARRAELLSQAKR